MADIARLERALRNADAAGDVDAARMLAAEIMKMRGATTTPQSAAPSDPTEGMSGTQKFLAGTGKAFVDIGRGAGQLLREGIEAVAPPQKRLSDLVTGGRGSSFADTMGLPTRADIDEAKKRDAALMNTGAGLAGNIFGNVAAAAPTAMIPGANTITGGALVGAASSAIQPVGTDDSRFKNIGIGAAAGGAVPLAIRTGKVLKALSDPLTEKGRQQIAGRVINSAVGDRAKAMANLVANRGATPGFSPTAGQAAQDAGMASLERTARAIDPGGFGAVDDTQRAALVNALRGIAKNPEDKAAAIAARDEATNSLYDTAKKATVPGDSEFEQLMQRPSMRAAMEEAKNLAQERGQAFAMPQGPAPAGAGILDASGNPMRSAAQQAPAQYSGQALHDLKMGLDTAIKDPARGFVEAKRKAAMGTKDEFLQWLEQRIPEYGAARQTYAEMSKPINQMDIGQELYNRFVPALADNTAVPFKSRADALAQALRNGDELAKNVTGMRGATMAGTMEPEQMQTLAGIVKDAQLKAAADSAGRGVGSDTVQKMSMSNLIDQSGIPTWAGAIPFGSRLGGLAQMAGDKLYKGADERMRNLLAETLMDPEATLKAMQRAGVPPSKIAEYLRISAQGQAMALPAVVNGAQQ
ncbi:hypothetical protein [Massilia endophytica]|uniref:hypothetical protein n=1 Tax=Massilia endophytica TaxID=2899220 RepID=UPI001E2F98F5|nr:hypothetical protein [Massilia endophytica]UGQ44976.1 hypothetical protein LSQ66_14335 [Massilia endophytica]